ncbi:AraC-like DNA-binding protein [Tenacibaculum sp. 190524A05c]|uniref:helix-turn-helix domain-containing protein n=1 Tax=Tenacibaculum platacis TaxID=3137852 RepID=UPI0031FB86AA
MLLRNLNIKYLFFFFIISSSSFSQAVLPNKYFKEKEALRKIRKFKNINLDSLLFYADKMKRSDNNCDQLLGLSNEAYYSYRQRKYDIVINVVQSAIKKADLFIKKDPKNLCYVEMKLNLIGRLFWTYRNLEKYNLAYKEAIKASRIINSTKDQNFNQFIYGTNFELFKAYIKNDLDLYVDAKYILKNLVRKIDTFEIHKKGSHFNKMITERRTSSLNMIGEAYFNLSNKEQKVAYLDSASFFYKRAYEAGKRFNPPHPDSELMYQFKETKVLIAKKKYLEALELISHYNYPKLAKKIDYQKETQYFKALCFHNLRKTDSAIQAAKKSILNTNLRRSKLITIYDILSFQYLAKNKLDSAFKYSKLTMKEFDNAKTLKEKTYEILYDNDLEKVTKLNNSILEKEKYKNLITLLTYSSILAFLLVLFFLRRKQYKRQLSEIKTMKNELTMKELPKRTSYNIEADLERKILAQIKEVELNHAYLNQDFSIHTMAEMIKTNVTYVSFIFNKHYDITFNQYYSKKKIDYAIRMLNDEKTRQKYSIEGIAKEVGYKSAYAFSRAFKKHIKITPSEFIKNLKK